MANTDLVNEGLLGAYHDELMKTHLAGGVVFDISAYNLTNGQPTPYADLAAALGTNGANVPEPLRKGGMSVKFVCSVDNKYVQFRLKSQTFSTDEKDWLCDEYPNINTAVKGSAIFTDGHVGVTSIQDIFASDFYKCEEGVRIVGIRTSSADIIGNTAVAFYDAHFLFVGRIVGTSGDGITLTSPNIPSGAEYIRANLKLGEGYILGENKKQEFLTLTDQSKVTLSVAYQYKDLRITPYFKATNETIGGETVTIAKNSIKISTPNYIMMYIDRFQTSFFSTAKSVRFEGNPLIIPNFQCLYIHAIWSDDTSVYSELIVSDNQDLHTKSPNEYLLLAKNSYGHLTGGLLTEALIDYADTVDGFKYDNTRYYGYINEFGEFVKGSSLVASNYFYAKRGSLIHIETSVSLRRIAFYDKHLDFITEVTLTGTDYDYYLTDENIPSDAVYFRTNISSGSYVYGEVAFGDSSSYKFDKSIVLAHEFGNTPKVSSLPNETVTLTYENNTRVYIHTYTEPKYNLNLNNPLGTALFPAGKISIPRYSWMFIDTRVDSGDTYQCPVVADNNYNIVDDETKHYDTDAGLYYNKINGIKYYGKRGLPGGLFIKILVTGAGCMISGPFLDSITDKRNQYIEKDVNSIQQTLTYGEYTPMVPVAEQQNKIIDNSGDVVDKSDYPFNIVTFAVNAGSKYGIRATMPSGWNYYLIYYSTDINAENIVGRESYQGKGNEDSLYVPSADNSSYYEMISVPDGASYMHINVRATEFTTNYLHVATLTDEHTFSAQSNEERLLRIEESIPDEGSIFSLNPESEYSSLMVNAKARRYDRVNAQYKEYPISLLWFSDLHANSEGITNLQRLLAWKDKYSSYIDDVIATGDQQSLYFTDNFSYWDANAATNVLQVIGNHDAWISKAMYQTGDYDDIVERGYGPYDSQTGLYAFYIIHQKDVYDKYFKDRISGWGVTQPADASTLGKNYYYKDYSNRVRLIVLDAKHYGSPDDLDGNNQSIQNAWFTSVLEDARTNNLEVVVSSHYYPTIITQNRCSWNYNYWGGNGDDKLNSLATTAVSNFINTGGTFICWMVGHTHYDDIGLVTTDNNQLVIGCSTANNTRSTAFVRPTGTKLQDSFNIISFDTSDGKVNILKVGGDTNNNFTRRRVLSYQYKAVTDEFGVEHQKGLIFSE